MNHQRRNVMSDTHIGVGTCAALSSGKGKAGVALVRVSGAEAIEISSKVFVPRGRKLSEVPSNTAAFGDIYSGGEKFDSGIATVFRAPKSFTGEDTVEICCHGSEVGISMLLAALFESGAVPAGPGEFTKRAFLNGKLDLTQAEAIGELIDAESESAARLSNAKANGLLGKEITRITSSLLGILSAIYAFIDYPDEDIEDTTNEEMRTAVYMAKSSIEKLLSTYDTGRAIAKGVNCAIVGAPNVGKSSMLNMLCGRNRAIVTDIAGTTRDVITESVKVGNITLLLSDTAGIRESDDPVEKIGVERSFEALENAELIFLLLDVSRKPSDVDISVIEKVRSASGEKHVITVANKSDVGGEFSDEIEKLLHGASLPLPIYISASNGDGYDKLTEAVESIYPCGDSEIRSGLILTTARQHSSMKKALEFLDNALVALETLTPDMACAEIENAVAALGETDGRNVNEEIVSEIFSHFCVGK